jgi:hypothetical protein
VGSEGKQLERPRSVAAIIAEALDMYQRHPLLFLTLALGVIAPYGLAVLAFTGANLLGAGSNGNLEASLLLQAVDFVLVGPLVSALHIHAVLVIGRGERPRLGAVALRALRVLPGVVAAVIVSGAGILLGFLALIVPGIVLTLLWSVVAQAAAVEHQGWQPALRRSRELASEHYWHILGLLLLTGAMSGGLTAAVAAIPLGSPSGALSVAVGIATRTVTASFTALTLALLYFDLIGREREGSGPAAAPREHPHLRDLD